MPLSHNQPLRVTAPRQFSDQNFGLTFTTTIMRSQIQMADTSVNNLLPEYAELSGPTPNTKAPAGP